MPLTRAELDVLPRLGWVAEPTPVTALESLARELGLGWLGVKRDDLCTPLHGGSKVRKLDFLLRQPPWDAAQRWATVGAIGSGHLVACVAAAQLLGRQVHADVFWEPLSHGVLDNLAWTASWAHSLRFHRSRVGLALTAAPALVGTFRHGGAVVPPGATHPWGALGLVRAGLELGEQVRAGLLPPPDRVYVALGSGGTVAGLALGLELAGLRCAVHAVYTVEPVLSPVSKVRRLVAATRKLLAVQGVALPTPQPLAIVVSAAQLGRGYGVATQRSVAARQALQGQQIPAEDVYTGKAFAGLCADARREPGTGQNWLFWNTVRRDEALPTRDDWRTRLPGWLAQRLEPKHGPVVPRRRVLAWTAAAVGIAALGRAALRQTIDGGDGLELSDAELGTLAAATQALVSPEPGAAVALDCARAVDRFVCHMPGAMRRDIHMLLAVVELGLPGLLPFSAATPADRVQRLQRARSLGGPALDVWNGLRDLVFLGYWQRPAVWPAIGYPGPMVPSLPRPARAAYARLTAPPGALPPGAEAWAARTP